MERGKDDVKLYIINIWGVDCFERRGLCEEGSMDRAFLGQKIIMGQGNQEFLKIILVNN